MTAEIYPVATGLPGAVSIMPHPPADRLAGAMRFYRQSGVTAILSMLPDDESRMLGLGDEAAQAAEEGIAFMSHPIPDFGLPDMSEFEVLIRQLTASVQSGAHLAVHCRAGIGRSGLVAASLLCALGASAEAAIKKTSAARGCAIPDTVEQGAFIASFAARL